jgi:hypothetical protein
MVEIEGIYILNSRGDLIFLQENLVLDSKEMDADYLSNFLSTLQTIAQKIGEDEVKIIDLGNSKFFLIKDKLTKIEFILKCNKEMKYKKVSQAHKNIVNLFIEKFTGNFNSSEETKTILMNSFIKELNELVGPGEKTDYHLQAIKIN